MKATKHKITSYLQPTNSACGEAAIAMLLSHYGLKEDPSQLMKDVPQTENEEGVPFGSITALLVTWAQQRGFQCKMYAFDCLVLDLSWQGYSKKKLLERLKAVQDTRDVAAIGPHFTKEYIKAYIKMLNAGAELEIRPFVTPDLLYELLKSGPVFATICSTVARGRGRTSTVGLRKSEPDDVNGRVLNHSIVLYGNDADGNFLIADPWKGNITMDPLKLVVCIMAAQVECDNQLVVVTGVK